MKGVFVFEVGRLAYRRRVDSNHWHLGISTCWDDGPEYDLICDLTIFGFGCFYWRRKP